MAKKGYIYKYTFPNGRVYVGQTTASVKEAHYQHISLSKNPQRRQLVDFAIAYYGEPVLETIETIEVADHEELKLNALLKKAKEKWINYYDSTVVSRKGFNVRGGGMMMSWVEFLLTEKMYEIYEKEKWEEKIKYIEGKLDSIGNKICKTKQKLTEEEENVWSNLKFCKYDYYGEKMGKTTFSSYYKRNNGEDYGDVPYKVLEVLQSKDVPAKKKQWAEQIQNRIFFDNSMKDAFKFFVDDVWQTIREKVNKQEKELVKLMELQEERRREGIEKAQFKRDIKKLARIFKK